MALYIYTNKTFKYTFYTDNVAFLTQVYDLFEDINLSTNCKTVIANKNKLRIYLNSIESILQPLFNNRNLEYSKMGNFIKYKYQNIYVLLNLKNRIDKEIVLYIDIINLIKIAIINNEGLVLDKRSDEELIPSVLR